MIERIRRERLRLRLLVAALVAIAVLSVLALVHRESSLRREQVSSALTQQGKASIREYQVFFRLIREELGEVRGWGKQGKLDLSRPGNLDRILIPSLRNQAWASEIVLTGPDDSVYRLREGAGGWASEVDPSGEGPMLRSNWYLAGLSGDVGQLKWTSEGAEATMWVSVSWQDPGVEGRRCVAGIRVTAEGIEDTIGRSPISEKSMVAIVGPENQLFWQIRDQGPRFRPADLEDMMEPEVGPEGLLAHAFGELFEGRAQHGKTFRFEDDGETWWGWWGQILGVERERELLLLAPESDLGARHFGLVSPGSYLLLGLFGICAGLLLRRTFRDRSRLDQMTRAGLRTDMSKEEILRLIDSGEGDRLEFKSTMRWSLRKKEPRHEVALSWLKTVIAFLNTHGGTVLLGVRDDGGILGIEADRLRDDDHYMLTLNALLRRHVGVEFLPYLRYAIHPVDEKSVLVLNVLPADEPAFLIVDDDDQFYVRMGPSTCRLNLRQTFKWIKDFGNR